MSMIVDVWIGSILLAFIAILLTVGMIWRSEKKHAAVGRRYGMCLFAMEISTDMEVGAQGNAIIFARLYHYRDL